MTGEGARTPLHISPEKGMRRPGRGDCGKYKDHTNEIGAGKAATDRESDTGLPSIAREAGGGRSRLPSRWRRRASELGLGLGRLCR
jgi:hypothetical protein